VSRIILVADDNMTIQRMATEMLSEQGLEVVTVANGVAAIKKLATLKPVMVLADVDMPGRDGYEVCDFVKKSSDLCGVPVILAFSDADPFDQERVKAVRADGVVKKPFNKIDLLARVEEFIPKVVQERPAPSESSPRAGAAPKAAQEAPSPLEFSFTEKPAQPASFQGIPEGAGLFEPEFAVAASPGASPAAPYEAVPAFTSEPSAHEFIESHHTESVAETEFARARESSPLTAGDSLEPGAPEFSFVPPSQADGEGLPSLAGVAIGQIEVPARHAMPEAAVPTRRGEDRPPASMPNASPEIVGTFGELEMAGPIVAFSAQEAAPEASPTVMQVPPQTFEGADSEPDTNFAEIRAEDHTGSAALHLPVDNTASKLGDWKLHEAGQMEQDHAEMQEPVLAVLPDVTAELHFPAPIEESELKSATPLEPENQPKGFVVPKMQETGSPAATHAEELAAPPQPMAGVSADSGLETETLFWPVKEGVAWKESPAAVPSESFSALWPEVSGVEIEENKSAKDPSGIAQTGFASIAAPEPLALNAKDEEPFEMPASVMGMEANERTGAEKAVESSTASAPGAAISPVKEEEVESSTAATLDDFSSAEPETPVSKSQDHPSWEIPSEAALNQAFLEAALSSIGLVHITAPADAPGQSSEPSAAPEEVAGLLEDHSSPSVGGPQEAEPPMASDSSAAQPFDRKLVESIVQRVVVRMSPLALSPEMIQQVTRKLTEECLDDLFPGQS